jgi:hypothetical protein
MKGFAKQRNVVAAIRGSPEVGPQTDALIGQVESYVRGCFRQCDR